jgi:Asp-tRNA(Asn)/Glu-tRNA(Gln) amidotransferase A subunit family amidase
MDVIGPNTAAVRRARDAIAAREHVVRAWAFLDLDRASAEAAQRDRESAQPMSGTTLAIKDMFDTADYPTEYGSALFTGHQPRADAAVVARLRAAGAIPLGKTVTAELACAHPGPTTNPHDPSHTPGGSSMGSAAAVAAGMADVALGTQTAASITRPASYCGVYGFKPSFGTVSTAGLKLVSPSLDTVGWFAREPRLLQLVHTCLTGRPASTPADAPRFAVCRTPMWEQASLDSQHAVHSVEVAARERGARVRGSVQDSGLSALCAAQLVIQAYETAQSLAWEAERSERLSESLRSLLDAGDRASAADYDDARAVRREAGRQLDTLFGDADFLITPAAPGEAPEGLGSTGDPLFGRPWSLLGLPAVSIPWATGGGGLPVGVQLVARAGRDSDLLAATRWLAAPTG